MICEIKKDGKRFNTAAAAIMAMQAAQMYYSLAGYLTTARVSPESSRIELNVYFEDKPFPTLPNGYMYTEKEIHSYEYFSELSKEASRIRTIDFIYKY